MGVGICLQELVVRGWESTGGHLDYVQRVDQPTSRVVWGIQREFKGVCESL